ncbi:ABC transporter ATP-binding protein [[Clostridium] sordellii]|nr:ABC transporter ATP-binding protein [[Clostridium] sordellii] [Paeniclostridium sordellii]
MELSHNPKLIIMDEPTANLDPLVRNEFLDIL